MAKNDKLYITISDNRGGGTTPPTPQTAKEKEEKESGSLLADYAQHEFLHLIKSTGKNMVGFGVSQIGFLYGNYLQQENVSVALNLAGKVQSVAMSAYAGFKATGGSVWGAVIGAGVSITSETISTFQQFHTAQINNNRLNHNVEMLRMRSGLDDLNNGGRTGTQ